MPLWQITFSWTIRIIPKAEAWFTLMRFQTFCFHIVTFSFPDIGFSYSLSPGVWQSFVTIRSYNHLMRIISSMSTTQRKVRSREDDNYSNWVIINYGVYKGLYHISCLLQIIKPFIRPPQGLLFLVVKTF